MDIIYLLINELPLRIAKYVVLTADWFINLLVACQLTFFIVYTSTCVASVLISINAFKFSSY